MHAVLLFSALLHIAAIGGLAAASLRGWLNINRPKEPTFPEFVAAAAALGVAVALAATVVSWLGRGFGSSVVTGLAAGVLAALAFLLALGSLPHARPGFSDPPGFHVRMAALGLVGAMVLTETIVFCLLVASAAAQH